ncbi:MAG: phenylalanine--tRNA ligase subunit beta [Patescibacteria group bacterium]
MNLLISHDWLREYADIKGTAEEVGARVSLSGPGVERLYPQGQDLQGIVLGHVLKVDNHPNADKLRLASVDVGEKTLSIVCGGSNLVEGQWVAVATLGSFVRWHGEGDPVELKPAEIRGVPSEGMICAANEIGLFDAFPHAEREIMDVGASLPDMKLKAGTPMARVLGLDGDTVMDVEVTSNRTDLMSMVGMAREVSAILKQPFTWKPSALPSIKGKGEPVHVTVNAETLCPRYMAIRIDGVHVGPSPWWLKRRLLSAGLRPINNLVDITNYVLYELGQPMHVFDADKLAGEKLVVRKAKQGEQIAALDGKTYELDESMLVIADAEKPVAIAGVMGGQDTAVTSGTTSIIFESATFDAVSVRKTARKLNCYSDAQLHFEKGLSTEATTDALGRAVELCLELAGGTVSAKATDVRATPYKATQATVETDDANRLMGVTLTPKEMADTLKRLGFTVKKADKKHITAVAPWWRDHDMEEGCDLVEEIARMYGYAKIPAIIPGGVSTIPRDPTLVWETRLRHLAQSAGLTEVYTYSFVSRAMQERSGYDPVKMLRIQNPLSEDFEFMRTSLLPSLIDVVAQNQERARTQRLFEVANVYIVQPQGLPKEEPHLSAAFFGGEKGWKEAKGFAERVCHDLGITELTWKRLEDDDFWHPGRTVQAFVGEHLIGTIGELHPRLAEAWKLEERLAFVDMPLNEVFAHASTVKQYTAPAIFPEAKRDLALLVPRKTEVATIIEVVRAQSSFLRQVEWFDTFEGKGIEPGKKSVAFHLTFGADDRTLETAEVEKAMEEIRQTLKDKVDAEIR